MRPHLPRAGDVVRRVVMSCAALVGAAALAPSPVAAQPDVRLIRPNIMVLLDTSGSMEWNTRLEDNHPTCSNAGLDGGACNRCATNPTLSICAPGCTDPRTRWVTALEVLTGSIRNYSCQEVPRNDYAAPDVLYPIPHHLPLSNGVPLFRAGASQAVDGIFDVYAERVRFGLMTFDNDYATGLAAYDGMFSYGADRNYRLNCQLNISGVINNGARRASVDNNTVDVVPGGLISVGPPDADGPTMDLINQQLQLTLTGRTATMTQAEVPGVRPYGGTPIAGMLEDAYRYWTTHPHVVDGSTGGMGDPYFRCRTRANILITDGHPNEDFRRHPGMDPARWTCEGAVCPYDTPDATAMRMAMAGGSSPAARTYVIAFNAMDTISQLELEPIAVSGGTQRVYYANDRITLASALSSVVDTVTSVSSTRTPPVFGEAGTTAPSGTSQYRFNASFQVTPGYPWSGTLTRTRTVCQAGAMGTPPVPTEVASSLSDGDDFGYNLRAARRSALGWRAQRFLWTFVPSGAVAPTQMQGTILDAQAAGAGLRMELPSVPASLYGYSTNTERDALVSWLRGDPGTLRETRPLGDIYRSTPVFVPAPRLNLSDQTFTAYRQRALPQTVTFGSARTTPLTVGTREPMMYVGTNDGILHAFNTDTGEEVWGFVPPFLVPNVRAQYPNIRSAGVDGTPVVKEIYYERSPSSLMDDTSWRTIMVVGLRTGGGAYVALDVTDPYNPNFLWQFTDPDLVQATGQPAIATLFFTPLGQGTPVERAVAILSGGSGRLAPACPAGSVRPTRTNSLMTGWTGGRGGRRPATRCWQGSQGQYMYVVDLKTGVLVRKLGAGSMGAERTRVPLVGSPAVFNGQAGVVSTRAYVGDADGTLWRADFTSRDPSQWWLADVYDLFWDRTFAFGQPIMERPVTTIDAQGNVVVAFASGDSDLLEGTAENRVASFTERTVTDTSGQSQAIEVEANWEIRQGTSTGDRDLFPGERLTGAMTLFNGSLYFGTFIPRVSADACQIGRARLWGVNVSESDPAGSFVPAGAIDRPTGCPGPTGTTHDRVTDNFDGDSSCTADGDNTLLFGVSVQRPAACNVSQSELDPLTGQTRTFVSGINSGEYRIVLQTAQTGVGMGGTQTRSFSRQVAPPITPARIDSWATVFE